MAKSEEQFSEEAYNRLLKEIRQLHKENKELRVVLDKAGLEGLTPAGAVKHLLSAKEKLDEVGRLLNNNIRKPQDTLIMIDKVVKDKV